MASRNGQATSCERCQAGVLSESDLTVLDVTRMDPAHALTLEIYCECPAGRGLLSLVQRRAESDAALADAWRQMDSQREIGKRSSILAAAQIPVRFQAATLEAMARIIDNHAVMAVMTQWAQDGTVPARDGSPRRGVGLFGQPGTGKTSLATAAMVAAVHHWASDILWVDYGDLLFRVRAGYQDGSAYEHVERCSRAQVVLIDDLADPDAGPMTDHSRMIINQIIRQRHAQDLPTLFTTNLLPAELAEAIGERMFGRLAEMAVMLPLNDQRIRRVA